MLRSIVLSVILGATAAQAEGLKIVTDIAPVGSLVSRVTGHKVTILVNPGQSPHDASLKPSRAAALQEADIVVWMGEGMAPGLAKPIEQLAQGAAVLELMEVLEMPYLDTRKDAAFAPQDHDDQGHSHEVGHDHGDLDPHAWLSVDVAQLWLEVISAHILAYAPDTVLADNDAPLTTLITGIDLSSAKPVIALHDAFQYLETGFGLNVIGAVGSEDGSAPSAARLSQLQDVIAQHEPACLISDASESGPSADRMAATLGLRLIRLDILGAYQDPGPDLYPAMMMQIAKDLRDCL